MSNLVQSQSDLKLTENALRTARGNQKTESYFKRLQIVYFVA